MNTTPPPSSTETGPRVSATEIRDLGRLYRPVADRRVAGVAAGIARHLDIDPLLVRVGFVVLALFGGAGVLLYGACWLLVPEEGATRSVIHLDERNRGIALIGAAILAAIAVLGDSWGGVGFPWPLVVVGVIALLVVSRRDPHRLPAESPPRVRLDKPITPEDRAAWAAGAPIEYPFPLRSTSPRRRGPLLFGPTLALVALAVGILGTFDVAGASVTASAYPALATAVIAVMLILGAFWGRAGGLITLGLIAALAMGVTTTGETLTDRVEVVTPTSVDSMNGTYSYPAGDYTLDLTDLSDPGDLAGTDVTAELGMGQLTVLVPEGVDVAVHGSLGLGSMELLGVHHDEPGSSVIQTNYGRTRPHDTEIFDVYVQVGLGEIRVEER